MCAFICLNLQEETQNLSDEKWETWTQNVFFVSWKQKFDYHLERRDCIVVQILIVKDANQESFAFSAQNPIYLNSLNVNWSLDFLCFFRLSGFYVFNDFVHILSEEFFIDVRAVMIGDSNDLIVYLTFNL